MPNVIRILMQAMGFDSVSSSVVWMAAVASILFIGVTTKVDGVSEDTTDVILARCGGFAVGFRSVYGLVDGYVPVREIQCYDRVG